LCAILRGETKEIPAGAERASLLALAREHRVDRLVCWLTGHLDDDRRAEAILDEIQVIELNRVLAALEARGVVALVLKGAALAHTHYEQSWLRPRLDADLLIASSERDFVSELLCGLGYTRPPFISGELVMSQAPFTRSGVLGEEHALDVHWRLVNPPALAGLPAYEELVSRSRTVLVRGQAMRTLSPVDALMLACVHRAAHHDLAADLLWLYDIHVLAARFAADEWSDFAALASAHRVRALCGSGLRAAQACLHTPAPAGVISRLESGPTEPSAVFLKQDLRPLDKLLVDLGALASGGRVRLIVEHLLPSAGYISQKYGVQHRSLLPLFYLRRVIEGLGRWTIMPPRGTHTRNAASSSSDAG
jgi:hypothetical protein